MLQTQVFGDEEEIVGYKGLAIDISMDAQSFIPLLEVKFASKKPGATDIQKTLKENFPSGLFSSRPDYTKALAAEKPLKAAQLGTLVCSKNSEDGEELCVFQSNLKSADPAVQVCLEP